MLIDRADYLMGEGGSLGLCARHSHNNNTRDHNHVITIAAQAVITLTEIVFFTPVIPIISATRWPRVSTTRAPMVIGTCVGTGTLAPPPWCWPWEVCWERVWPYLLRELLCWHICPASLSQHPWPCVVPQPWWHPNWDVDVEHRNAWYYYQVLQAAVQRKQCHIWWETWDTQERSWPWPSTIVNTGRERLIRSHLSARFCFELSGNSN